MRRSLGIATDTPENDVAWGLCVSIFCLGALLGCGGQLLGDLDQASYSGDIAEIWRRYGGDIGEM